MSNTKKPEPNARLSSGFCTDFPIRPLVSFGEGYCCGRVVAFVAAGVEVVAFVAAVVEAVAFVAAAAEVVAFVAADVEVVAFALWFVNPFSERLIVSLPELILPSLGRVFAFWHPKILSCVAVRAVHPSNFGLHWRPDLFAPSEA